MDSGDESCSQGRFTWGKKADAALRRWVGPGAVSLATSTTRTCTTLRIDAHRRGAFQAGSDAQRDAWAQHARRVAAKARFWAAFCGAVRRSWHPAGAAHLPPPPASTVRMVAASRALACASGLVHAQSAMLLGCLMLSQKSQAAQGWAFAPQHTAAVADAASTVTTRFLIPCRCRLRRSFPCSSSALTWLLDLTCDSILTRLPLLVPTGPC